MGRKIDITGEKFNRLTAVRFDHYNEKNHSSMWLFLCDCGVQKVISKGLVKFGSTKSCGCYNKEILKKRVEKHGMTNSKEFKTWVHIRQRCSNETCESYPHYGGRGIKVCNRWLESFDNFYNDMRKSPSPNHSIGRIDNDKDYSPENCRWETSAEQNMNYSRNLIIEIDGVSKPLKAWTDDLGLKYSKVIQRIQKLKWCPKRALEID